MMVPFRDDLWQESSEPGIYGPQTKIKELIAECSPGFLARHVAFLFDYDQQLFNWYFVQGLTLPQLEDILGVDGASRFEPPGRGGECLIGNGIARRRRRREPSFMCQYEIPFAVVFRDDTWWNASTGEELDAFVTGWSPPDYAE